jgi:hypothetical protein
MPTVRLTRSVFAKLVNIGTRVCPEYWVIPKDSVRVVYQTLGFPRRFFCRNINSAVLRQAACSQCRDASVLVKLRREAL